MTRLLLLHGAGLGAWIWNDVLPHLDDAEALDLPGRTHPANVTLAECVDFVAKKLTSDSVLVGHSIGALVAMAAASSRPVKKIVLVGGTVPESGRNFLSLMPLPMRLFMRVLLRRAKNGIAIPPKLVEKGYCNDLDEATTARVLRELRPEVTRLYLDPVTWTKTSPTAYVRLLRDESVKLKEQDVFAARVGAGEIVELSTGHLPMLAQPKAMADVLRKLSA
jgi:pimeloyl-ACP methyl ester carboxylesterase